MADLPDSVRQAAKQEVGQLEMERLLDLIDGVFVDGADTYIEAQASVGISASLNLFVAAGGVTGELDADVTQEKAGTPRSLPEGLLPVRTQSKRGEGDQGRNKVIASIRNTRGSQGGPCGDKTEHLERQAGCSRQAAYNQAQRVEQMVSDPATSTVVPVGLAWQSFLRKHDQPVLHDQDQRSLAHSL